MRTDIYMDPIELGYRPANAWNAQKGDLGFWLKWTFYRLRRWRVKTI